MALVTGETIVAPIAERQRYLEWGPVIGGAVAAAAISFLLLTFGAAVGLSVTSPWPGRGVSLTVAAWAVVWWAVLVQVGSFAAGGYLAGRMRSRWGESITEAGEFRDGAHGFLVWALGVLIGAFIAVSTAGGVLKATTQSATTIATGAAAGKVSELSVAPTDYAVDLLLRPAPSEAAANANNAAPANDAGPRGNDAALRSEAGRIFSASIQNREFTERDRNYLTQVVMTRTGLPQAEAEQRVDAAMNEARDLELKVRQQADQARKATVIAGFIAAASLLISAAAACFGAGVGGRHRDEGRSPAFFGHRRIW